MFEDVQTVDPNAATPGPQATPPPPTTNPWSDADDAAARTYFSNYLTGHSDYGDVNDGIRAYQQQRQAGLGHDQALAAAMQTLGWQTQGPHVDPPVTGTGTGGGGNTGGPQPNVGGLISPFGKDFKPPPASPYPDAPTFTPPSMADAANDPGYQFGLSEGKRNLDSWLAAHGTFNDSSAAEALQNYGRNAATQQYGSVWDRAYQQYQGALGPWQTTVARTEHDNDTSWQNAFNTWLQNWNVFKDQRDSTFDKQWKVTTA